MIDESRPIDHSALATFRLPQFSFDLGHVLQARAVLGEAERYRSDPAYRADQFVAEWTRLRLQARAKFRGEKHKLPKITQVWRGSHIASSVTHRWKRRCVAQRRKEAAHMRA